MKKRRSQTPICCDSIVKNTTRGPIRDFYFVSFLMSCDSILISLMACPIWTASNTKKILCESGFQPKLEIFWTPWGHFDLFHKISYLHIYMSSLILMKFLVMINVLDESVEFWWNKNQTKHETTRPFIFRIDRWVRRLKQGLIRRSAITNIKIFIDHILLETLASCSIQSFFSLNLSKSFLTRFEVWHLPFCDSSSDNLSIHFMT